MLGAMPPEIDELAHEIRWLRDLLGRVAADLAALSVREPDPARARALARRAMRLRARLHESPPAPDAHTLGVGRGP